MSTWDKFSSFISAHRAAVLIGSAAVIGSTAGVYYYYSTVDPSAKPVKKSKKKSEKKTEKKKSSKSAGESSKEESSAAITKKNEIGGFPLVKEPTTEVEYPEIPKDANLKSLSADDKQAIANQFKLVGNSFFGLKKYDEALEFYQKAINVSDDPIYYSNRAACFSALEQYDNVIAETTAALKLKPDYMKCILRRAVAYEKLGKLEDAILDDTSALILKNFVDPALNSTVDRLIQAHALDVLETYKKDDEKSFPSASFCAAFLGSVCDVNAVPDFVKDAEPESADYNIKLALEALKVESITSYEQAYDLFSKAIEQDGDHTYFALAYRSALKFLCSDIEGAREDARKSIELKDTAIPHLINASIELEKSNITGATSEMAQADVAEPDSAFTSFHRGQLCFLVGELDEALKHFETAGKNYPNLVMAHIQAAVSHYRLGNTDKAHKKFKNLIEEFPQNLMAELYHGEIYMDQKQFKEAEDCFDRASELSKVKPGDINVHPLINKAHVFLQKGQTQEALETLRKAATLDPKSDMAWSSLYQFYSQLQLTEESINAMEKAINVARSDPEKLQHAQLLVATRVQERLKKERPFIAKKMDAMQQNLRSTAYAQEIASR